MNIFVIPSLYPSANDPFNGIFIKEQFVELAMAYPELNIGVARWGQNDDDYLLFSRQPIRSLAKVLTPHKPFRNQISPNLVEYFHPAWSFHEKFQKGNIRKKTDSALKSLAWFERDFGRCTVVHAQVIYPAGQIALEVKNKKKIPYLITEHIAPIGGGYLLKNDEKLKEGISEIINGSVGVTAVSAWLKNRMEPLFPEKKIRVVPNFTFAREMHENISSNPFVFCSIGAISFQKGVDLLLEAIALLQQKRRDFLVQIVGDGPDEIVLKQRAHHLGVEERIIWKGPLLREEVNKVLEISHAHVLCSRQETFGMVFIEAMACGLPNIAFSNGGQTDIIHESNGILVSETSAEAMAEAMGKMMENYHLFDRGVIRNDFKERFSTQAVGPKWIDIYTHGL
jgi:glycosyltransferase involved in cell wall biosynthesis